MKISVIVPIFNCEDYLAQCIESVLSQQSHEIELILVNDGSTDSSGKICDNYALKDNRLKVIHITNGGPGRARNVGLSYATGKWVIFVDADDWLDSNTFDLLRKDEKCADIVFFGFKNVYSDQTIVNYPKVKSITTNTNEIDVELVNLLLSKEQFFGFSVNKFFLRSIIEKYKIRFTEGLSIKEDEIFTLNYIKHIKSVEVISHAPYNYRILDSSLSHAPNKYRGYFQLAECIEKQIDLIPFTKTRLAFINRCIIYYISAIQECLQFKSEFTIVTTQQTIKFYQKFKKDISIPMWYNWCMNVPTYRFKQMLLILFIKIKTHLKVWAN